jgi:PAS domain S-box-containing protein
MIAALLAEPEGRSVLAGLHGQLPQGVAVFDVRLRLVHANPSWLAFVRHVSRDDASLASGMPIHELLPEHDGWLHPALDRALAGEMTRLVGQLVASRNGETFWDITLAPISHDGLVTGLVSVVEDATTRVIAEQAAAEQVRLVSLHSSISAALTSSDDLNAVLQGCVESLVHHVPAMFARVWVLDGPAGTYTLRASASHHGWMNGTDAHIPSDWILQETFAAHSRSMETDLLRSEQVRESAWVSHPLAVRERVVGHMVMFARQNVTDDMLIELSAIANAIAQFIERQAAEDALREREAQYRSIFAETTDGLVIYTLGQRHIVEANPALCALTGFRRDDLLGMDPLRLIVPEDRQRVVDAGDVVTDLGRFLVTVTISRQDGTTFDAELNRTTFLYQGTMHALAVVRDITERAQSFRFMEQRVAERTQELQTLLEISRSISLASELDPLLQMIFDQLRRLVDYETIGIGLIDHGQFRMVAVRGDERAARTPTSPGDGWPISRSDHVYRELAAGHALYSPNVYGDDPVARVFRQRVGELIHTTYAHVHSWLAAPLIVHNELTGILFIASGCEDRYGQHDIDLVVATASQVAVAIQNARLHAQARSVAALEERQRLARELHDSVSQALFGIGLGAETARAMIERNPPQAIPAIDYVLQLAHGGMAEMRALIFELRPESLEQEGLIAALEKQAAATRARHSIDVDLAAGPEPDIPLHVKEALYRIAQEAMHNTVKHARATQIDLRVVSSGGTVTLEAQDNGQGFDAGGSFPGHLGLVSMRERIMQLGGTLALESEPGAGTRIRASVPITHPRTKAGDDDTHANPRSAG